MSFLCFLFVCLFPITTLILHLKLNSWFFLNFENEIEYHQLSLYQTQKICLVFLVKIQKQAEFTTYHISLLHFTMAHCGQKVHMRNFSFMYFQWKSIFFVHIWFSCWKWYRCLSQFISHRSQIGSYNYLNCYM